MPDVLVEVIARLVFLSVQLLSCQRQLLIEVSGTQASWQRGELRGGDYVIVNLLVNEIPGVQLGVYKKGETHMRNNLCVLLVAYDVERRIINSYKKKRSPNCERALGSRCSGAHLSSGRWISWIWLSQRRLHILEGVQKPSNDGSWVRRVCALGEGVEYLPMGLSLSF
jgi:hypothetical protein